MKMEGDFGSNADILEIERELMGMVNLENVVNASYRSPDEAKAEHRKVVEEWKGKLVGYES
ncbi:hypothetical protein J4442_00310 [Candidatus Woesearchaeota archaeon]|nr:hypothetical protein [Candidatus Woesearchaeota archaeon]